jgi:choline transport protein
MYVCFPI